MHFTRRQLMQAGAVAGAGILLQPRAVVAARTSAPMVGSPPMFTQPLPTLADFGVMDMRAGGTAELWMRNARHSFHSHMGLTDTFAYQDASGSQTYLGPIIVAERGTPFALTVHNGLARHPLAYAVDAQLVPPGTNDADFPRTSTHLHGGNTRPGSDGGPEQVFLPGASFTYSQPGPVLTLETERTCRHRRTRCHWSSRTECSTPMAPSPIRQIRS